MCPSRFILRPRPRLPLTASGETHGEIGGGVSGEIEQPEQDSGDMTDSDEETQASIETEVGFLVTIQNIVARPELNGTFRSILGLFGSILGLFRSIFRPISIPVVCPTRPFRFY